MAAKPASAIFFDGRLPERTRDRLLHCKMHILRILVPVPSLSPWSSGLVPSPWSRSFVISARRAARSAYNPPRGLPPHGVLDIGTARQEDLCKKLFVKCCF